MMLPILISVSVAAVSYFFCASAPLLEAASKAIAVEAIARRVAMTDITVSPCCNEYVCIAAFLTESSCDFDAVDTILPRSSQQKAPATKPQGPASFVVSRAHREPLTTDVRADDVAKPFPGIALEPAYSLSSPLMMSPNRSHFSPLNRII